MLPLIGLCLSLAPVAAATATTGLSMAADAAASAYAAVAVDPMKPIFQIYKDLRTDIGRGLTDEERKSFNCENQELYSLKVQLYKHRRKFIPTKGTYKQLIKTSRALSAVHKP